jgi:hypothetical protein
VVSRQSLKLASGVRFVHSQPQRIRLVVDLMALDHQAIVRFDHPLPIFYTRASFNWIGSCATNAETWGFESLRPYHFAVCRSTGQGTSLRRMRSGFESRQADHFSFWPVAQTDRAALS